MSTKVAFDVTPLLGPRSGVGETTSSLFEVLCERSDIELSAFAMSLRGLGSLGPGLPASMKRNRLPMPASFLQKVWARTAAPKIEKWIGSVDVVHGTNFVVPPTNGAALVTVHDLTAVRFPEMCEPSTLRYPNLIKVAVARGAQVHTYSQFVGDEVHELLDVPKDKIHVIPAATSSMSKAVAPPITGSYVLALGTVEPRKNFPMLVKAFDEIAAKHPDLRLIIAGGRGWAFDEVQAAIGQADNAKQIQYIGRVSDEERTGLINNAIAMAYPSLYEGFGLPPLEAMKAGVPVVASNAGALPEVLGSAALFVDPSDQSALAEALHSVLDDEKVRSRLKADGEKQAAKYDWKKSADQFIKLYKALAA